MFQIAGQRIIHGRVTYGYESNRLLLTFSKSGTKWSSYSRKCVGLLNRATNGFDSRREKTLVFIRLLFSRKMMTNQRVVFLTNNSFPFMAYRNRH